MSYDLCMSLKLINGCHCVYTAKGDHAVEQIKKIGEVCQLSPIATIPDGAFVMNLIQIERSEVDFYSIAPAGVTVYFDPTMIIHMANDMRSSTVYIVKSPAMTDSMMGFLWRRVYYLPIISFIMHSNATLIHGILAESDEGKGVILSGPSGIGKSTAARRLSTPWQVLADDCLIAIKHGEEWYAQPVPTWSIWHSESAPPRSFETQRAVKLAGLFLLDRGKDCAVPLDYKQSIVGLTRSVGDMSKVMIGTLPAPLAKQVFNRSFSAAAKFVSERPSFILYATLEGKFWENMEQAIC